MMEEKEDKFCETLDYHGVDLMSRKFASIENT